MNPPCYGIRKTYCLHIALQDCHPILPGSSSDISLNHACKIVMKDYLRTELKEDSAASSAEKSRTYIVFRRFGKAVAVAAITITLLFSTAMVANAQFREKVIAWVVETFEKYSIFELQSNAENTKIESVDKDAVIKIAVGITTERYTILAEQIRIDQHLYLALLLHRDYFTRPDSSLSRSFVPQGLFRPAGCIPDLLFFITRIIFSRPDASLACSFVPQGLFPPARFISSLLFCSTGIISAGQIHPCLAFLFRRDYFIPVRYVPIAENISARPFRQLPIFPFLT